MNTTIEMVNLEQNEKMAKEFGIFVGLYNRTNETNLSVKQAAMIDAMVTLFMRTQYVLSSAHKVVASNPNFKDRTSTKLKSYSMLDIPKVDGEVLDYIKANPALSRYEIAEGLNIRLSTICGAVNRLAFNNFVFPSGIKVDQETKRKVEAISAI